jgi:hypothetical protein
VTITEIKDDCSGELQIAGTRGWGTLSILSHTADRIQTKSNPEEEHDFQVLRLVLSRTVQKLKEHVQACPSESCSRQS